ncbi:hypothetical protein [Gluconacetobacter asukensis]|uniref:Uncharacterized protein n=1 Tax=Gluconacetobacter asukensis TaxID=1017181 RepID=A0A7W4P3F2_9PROT|nr:hypothetical protein [Gluconacetobacter asukensis]MBB2173923.1 hypothetical protein [Gluconacetobacter asukensis]
MPPQGAGFINIAHGAIVDEDALPDWATPPVAENIHRLRTSLAVHGAVDVARNY